MQVYLNNIIDSLSLDHKRGAAEIVDDAADLFLAIAKYGIKSPSSADQLFTRAVRRLAQGQPSMAPVLNLLNRVCLAREKCESNWENLSLALTKVPVACRAILDKMNARISEIPAAKDTLIAFSNSSTVARMIQAGRELGWPKRVLVGEGRPMMEGVALCRRLVSAGIPVVLMTDAALMSRIIEADAVWVGGDALSHKGLVNKIGSRALAMLAKMRDIPFISVMGSDKFLSGEMIDYLRFLPQNPREIAGDDADGIEIVNEYYETIPLDYVSKIFTEDGLLKPQKAIAKVENEPISELFKELVKVVG